jgi:alkanesulfonate monooxygenase SsuD/methylene tetrahydromethanopterin reductase-like flavin-dependent oxidoreductase (luciferase family)
MKLLIYGNLLPLHEPLRLAEELAMLDCLSGGRVVCGFARGIPREYQVYGVPLADSRARFEEAFSIITRAWTEEVFSHAGRFWNYQDISILPRPVQQPLPAMWMPVVSSKESIEFAARHNIPITPGLFPAPGLQEDIIRYYAKCLALAGHRITPEHLTICLNVYVADSKARAIEEYAPHFLYFNRTRLGSDHYVSPAVQRQTGYVSESATDYVRPENRPAVLTTARVSRLTQADVARQAEDWAWGAPAEIVARIVHAADSAGANHVQVIMNRGVLPIDMFREQIRRFGKEVLPALQAHTVERVPIHDGTCAA